MKPNKGPTREWVPPKPVPKGSVPQSGREESNNMKHAPPPAPQKPGFDDFRNGMRPGAPPTPPRRNGFMPGTPGGDEPPAPNTSAYSNYNTYRRPVPEVPPRAPPDPLRHFREQAGIPNEPRISTPYATHGGERTNPFESANLNRSKSTRDTSGKSRESRESSPKYAEFHERHRSASPSSNRRRSRTSANGIPRADSEFNLGGSPKSTRPHAKSGFSPRGSKSRPTTVEDNTSSDGDDSDSDMKPKSFGTSRRAEARRKATPRTPRTRPAENPSDMPDMQSTFPGGDQRKPTLGEFREWWWTTEDQERHMLNKTSDGPQGSQATANRGPDRSKPDQPSTYANPFQSKLFSSFASKKKTALPTVAEESKSGPSHAYKQPTFDPFSFRDFHDAVDLETSVVWSTCKMEDALPISPSGGKHQATPPDKLNPFERTLFSTVDDIVRKSQFRKMMDEHFGDKSAWSTRSVSSEKPFGPREQTFKSRINNILHKCRSPRGSPSSTPGVERAERVEVDHFDSYFDQPYHCSPMAIDPANTANPNSFSFNLDESTFETTKPPQSAFGVPSPDKISTDFTPEDWEGEFKAGNPFVPNPNDGRSTTRSKSGSRPKSPVKGHRAGSRSQTNLNGSTPANPIFIDPEIRPATDSEIPMSPGGTKFTAEEWAGTFKPQTFAPDRIPPVRTPSRPRRTRTGSAAPKVPNVHRTAGTAAMQAETSSDDSILEMGRRPKPTSTPYTNSTMPPPSGYDSPNAMDVDDPTLNGQPFSAYPVPAPVNGASRSTHPPSEPRNVPLEPSNPEWRSNSAPNGIPTTSTTAPTSVPQPTAAPETRPSTSDKRAKSRPSWAATDQDAEDFATTLEDLANVEPLMHPSGTGLHSFADLSSNLPFPSRAAANVPFPKDFSSGSLALPTPPMPPQHPIKTLPPPSADPNAEPVILKPSREAWDRYVAGFKAYMAEWETFNAKCLTHFVARKNHVEEMVRGKRGWLESIGGKELERYREGLREDRAVRECWERECRRHEDALGEFAWVRGVVVERGLKP